MPTTRQEGLQATKALTNRAAVGRMQTRCLTPAVVSGRSGLKGLGLKPYWGELTVRNFRGGRWRRDHGSRNEARLERGGQATGP